MAPISSVAVVFSIQELFEEIMQHVTMKDLFCLQRINRHFYEAISESKVLRRIMFLEPATIGIVIPIRTIRYISPRIPRRAETMWSTAPSIDATLLQSHIVRGRSDRLPNEVLLKLCEKSEVERPILNPMLEYWCINRKLDTILMKESPASHAEVGLRLVPHSCKSLPEHDSRRKMLITQPPVADVVIGRSDTLWGLYEAHNPKGVTIEDVLKAEEKLYGNINGPPRTAFIGWS